jgi:hypothetical protein
MSAQHPHDETLPADSDNADPIGPITLPKRGRIGSRALALVGTASVAAIAVHAFADHCTTFTTIADNSH